MRGGLAASGSRSLTASTSSSAGYFSLFFGLADLARDGVALAQRVLAHVRQRHVDVLGTGQVAGGPQEPVALGQDVEDAGRLGAVLTSSARSSSSLTRRSSRWRRRSSREGRGGGCGRPAALLGRGCGRSARVSRSSVRVSRFSLRLSAVVDPVVRRGRRCGCRGPGRCRGSGCAAVVVPAHGCCRRCHRSRHHRRRRRAPRPASAFVEASSSSALMRPRWRCRRSSSRGAGAAVATARAGRSGAVRRRPAAVVARPRSRRSGRPCVVSARPRRPCPGRSAAARAGASPRVLRSIVVSIRLCLSI